MIGRLPAAEAFRVYTRARTAASELPPHRLIDAEIATLARRLALDTVDGVVPQGQGFAVDLGRPPALKGLTLDDLFGLWMAACGGGSAEMLAAWDERLLLATELLYNTAADTFRDRFGSRQAGDAALLMLSGYQLRRSRDLGDVRFLNVAMKNLDGVPWTARPAAIERRLRSGKANDRLSGALAVCVVLGVSEGLTRLGVSA